MTDEPIMPPEPDPTRTTRERFEAHTTNPECRSCHSMIDPIGFAFESFDGMGAHRTTENGKAVDTKGVLEGTPIDGPIQDAADLAGKIAADDSVVRCFARNAFRFGSAQSGKTERAFLDFWEKQPPELRSSIVETFVAYVKSDLFVTRKVSNEQP